MTQSIDAISQRTERCQEALARYSSDTPFIGLIDLLADAMHWCDAYGEDFHYAICVAGKHFVAELNDEQQDERRMPPESPPNAESERPLPVPFDNYEISPCKRHEEPDSPGQFYFEPCEPDEADVWTLYGHIPGQGVEAIGDFATLAFAEEVFSRITGAQYRNPTPTKGLLP